nr:putative ribonuclease H-like domain-containing protein [Tanacetum cinerariifolium]
MDSLSPQVVSVAKFPILNPNEFDLWKIRIEQYFLMNNYSLWEVIVNGDSPVPTRVIEGVLQLDAPTTAEQKLARKNELKARGTTTQNLAFVSSSNTDSTTESVSAAASVSAIRAKMHVSSLPNVDSLSLPRIREGMMMLSHREGLSQAPQIVPSFVQSTEQVKSPRHFVQHIETSIPAATPTPASPKPTSSGKRWNRKACFMYKSVEHLIKDCDYHEKQMAKPTSRNHSKPVSITAVRPASTAVPKTSVTIPKQVKPIVTKSKSPIRRHLTRSQSPKTSNSPPRVTTIKAPVSQVVRGLPTKVFENDNTCVACKKGKKHKASCKTKSVSSVDQPLFRLHMDLFRPTFVKSVNKKSNCLVVTDDYSRFTWVFFLANKDETSFIFKTFITGLENQLSLKVKVMNSDNGTEFKNNDLNQFCGMKGIKKEFSVPRTPQQNGIAERKNKTLIEAAKTMLADSLLPIPFWMEAVNTACYVQNRVLMTKPHNKTSYELLHGRTPSIGFMRPFGCPVTILNTLDSVGKFDGKVDEGFLVGYSVSSKAFRVFTSRTRIVQETLHVNFLENKRNVVGSGPTWLFDIDSLTRTMNYQPVTVRNQTNPRAGFQDKSVVEKAGEDIDQQYVIFPVWSSGSTNPHNTNGDAAFDGKEPNFDTKKPESEVNVSPSSSAHSRKQDDNTKKEAKGKSHVESFTGYRDLSVEFEDFSDNSINEVNATGTLVPSVGQIFSNSTNTFSAAGPSNATASPTYRKSSFIDASQFPDDPDMPELEDITYSDDEDDVGAEADFNNLETSTTFSPIPTSRVHKDHHVTQIIGGLSLTTQTRSMTKVVKDQGGLSQMFNDDFHTFMFACFLSQEEPKRKVWILVDLPYGKRAIGTKWVFRNKKDERGIVVRNKARLVAQRHTQEEGIDYKEV